MKKEKIIPAPNLAKMLNKNHEDKWVALSSDYKKVLAVGDTLSVILTKSPRPDTVVMKVLPFLPYAPYAVM